MVDQNKQHRTYKRTTVSTEFEPVVVERIGTFTNDTADNRRYWSFDWHITGKKK